MSNVHHQQYITVINSLRRLASSLDRDYIFYSYIAKKTTYGNVIGAALFVAGIALPPYFKYYVLTIIGAHVWAISTAVGVFTQVAERSAISVCVEKAEKDLQGYMDCLRMSRNTDEIMGIVKKSWDIMKTRSSHQPSWNIFKWPGGTAAQRIDGIQNNEAVVQQKSSVIDRMQKLLAPSEFLRIYLQKTYGTPSDLADDVRHVISELDGYYRQNNQHAPM